MSYNRHGVKQYILEELEKLGIKYKVYNFDSGASMIDVWYDRKFYVIQLESESIGLSLVSKDNSGFDTIPDERFLDCEVFRKRIKEIFNIR